ncbi:tiny macrocysts protein C, partial [Haematococcus lacustris]
KAVILGDVIPFVALHRERYTLAVTLQVTQVSGISEDAMFMGVVVALPQSPDEAKVWLMLNLSVVSVCPNFTDWTAFKPDDVAGLSLKDLVVNFDILEPLAPNVLLQHKYHTPVQASIRITVGGVGKFRFLVLAIRRGGQQCCASHPTHPHFIPAPAPAAPAAAGEAEHLLVTDRKGRVCHATKGLATALRTSIKALVKGGAANALENLLPQPLALLHRSLAMSIPLHSPPAYSCRSGLAVPLLISGVRDNDSAPFRLRMYQQDKDALGADEVFHVTTLRQASMTEQLLGSCLADLLDVLQPPQPGAQDKTSRDKTGLGSYASAVLAHMAAEAFSRGEVGFRAGLLKPASQLVGRHISHFLPDLANMGDLSCLLEPVPPPGTMQLMHSPQGLVPAASAAAQTGRKGVLKSVVSLTAAELQQGKKPRGMASSSHHTYLRAPSRISLPKLSSFTKSGRVHPEASRELMPGGQGSSGQLLVEVVPYGGPGSGLHSNGQGVEADIVDGSDDAEGNRLDEGKADGQAELGVADYNRGKRYKKLARMLVSPLVQRHMTRFRVGALVLVATILAVHIAVFALLYSVIAQQRVGVLDLNNAGVSVRRGVEVSRAARWLEIILESKASVNPNLVGLQPTPADLKAMLAYYKGQLTQATTKHKAFYMGDGQQRALPTDYGLGRLWGQDSISATVWYEVPVSSLPPGANITVVVARDKTANGTFIKLPDNKIVQLVARQEKMSLWGLGNMMFANMDEVMHMAANVSSAGRLLDSWPPFRVCVDESNVVALSNGYKDSMDAMMQIVVARAQALNGILFIVMGAKGVALTLVLSLVLWSLAQRVGEQRYMIYSLFMVVPVGLLRGLATAKHNLEADGEEDEDDDML